MEPEIGFISEAIELFEPPQSLDEVVSAYQEAWRTEAPLQTIANMYSLLRHVAGLLTPAGEPLRLRKALLDAAVTRGVTKSDADATLRTIFIINNKTRDSEQRVDQRDAQLFAIAVAKILRNAGFGVDFNRLQAN